MRGHLESIFYLFLVCYGSFDRELIYALWDTVLWSFSRIYLANLGNLHRRTIWQSSTAKSNAIATIPNILKRKLMTPTNKTKIILPVRVYKKPKLTAKQDAIICEKKECWCVRFMRNGTNKNHLLKQIHLHWIRFRSRTWAGKRPWRILRRKPNLCLFGW